MKYNEELSELLAKEYLRGLDDGRNEGYDNGYRDGLEELRQSSYDEGYDDGFEAGLYRS